MKVLLVNCFSDDTRYNRFPLGLGYIAASLATECDVQVWDLIDDTVFDQYKLCLLNDTVDVVGITCTSMNLNEVLNIARTTKALNPRIFIIIGGPQPTAQPQMTLDLSIDIDCVMVGEAEENIKLLIRKLIEGSSLDGVPNIYSREPMSKMLRSTKISKIRNENYDFPMKYLPVKPDSIRKKYNLNTTPCAIITTRGCINTCSFCTVSLGKSVCCSSQEYAIEEIKYLVNEYNVDHLLINDADFLLSSNRAFRLIKMIKQIGAIRKISVNSCVKSINKISKNDFEELLEGIEWEIELGIESVNEDQLKRYNKKTTVSENFQALDYLFDLQKQIKLTILIDFILFDPYSSLHEFNDFIKFYKRYHLDTIEYEGMIKSNILLFPGTKIRERVIADGLAIDQPGIANYKFLNKNVADLFGAISYFDIEMMPVVNSMRNNLKHLAKDLISSTKLFKTYKLLSTLNSIKFNLFEDLYNCAGERSTITLTLKQYMKNIEIYQGIIKNL